MPDPRFEHPAVGTDIQSTFQQPKGTDLLADDVIVVWKNIKSTGFQMPARDDAHPNTRKYPNHKVILVEPSNDGQKVKITYAYDGPPRVSFEKMGDGQIATVTRTLVNEDDPAPTIDAKTVIAKDQNLTNGRRERTVGVVPETLPLPEYSVDGTDVRPEEFRANFPAETTSQTLEGQAVMPELEAGDLHASEKQQDKFTKRVSRTSIGDSTYPQVLVDRELGGPKGDGAEFSAELDIVKTVNRGSQPLDQGFDVLSSNVKQLGKGLSLKSTERLTNGNPRLTLLTPGSGYTTAPTVSFSGGTGLPLGDDRFAPGWVPDIEFANSQVSVPLNYVSDGDTNGVFYYLGSHYNNGTWQNPHTAGQIVLAASNLDTNQDIATLVDRTASAIHDRVGNENWFMADLKAARSVVLSKVSFRQRYNLDRDNPSDFYVQGSNDGRAWDLLAHATGLNTTHSAWNTITITAATVAQPEYLTTAYRYIRLYRVSPIVHGEAVQQYFTAGELELYGTLSIPRDPSIIADPSIPVAPPTTLAPIAPVATAQLSFLLNLGAVTITNGGSGYTYPPAVQISGGSGASAVAVLAKLLAEIVLTDIGSGYTSAPTVAITGGGGTGAAATAAIAFGLAGGTVTAAGSGYTSDPVVGVSGGGGTGAQFTAQRGFPLALLQLEAGGSGYTSDPTVSFSGGDGTTAATATAVRSFAVASLAITAGGSGYTSPPTVAFSGTTGSGAAATTQLGVNSLTVVSGGSGYAVNDIMTIASGTNTTLARLKVTAVSSGAITTVSIEDAGAYSVVPTGAVGTTNLLGGGTGASFTVNWKVSTLTMTAGGSGYETAPTLSFTGGAGTGATATATLAAGGTVSRLTLTAAGAGFTIAPAVTITGGGGSGAKASSVVGSGTTAGVVRYLRLVNPGIGYTTVPTLTISGGSGTGATATTAIATTGYVRTITLTNPGSGYTSEPTISFTGGGGSGAAALARLTLTGSVSGVSVVNAGTGLTTAPTISFVGGDGSGAAATASLATTGFVSGLTLVSPGFGYSTPPTVTISGGGGSGATAILDLTSYATLTDTVVDPVEGIVVNVEKKIVPMGTAYPGGFTEIRALDKWRSVQIRSKVDLSTLPPPDIFQTTHTLQLPDLLLSVFPVWDTSTSSTTRVFTGFSQSDVQTEVVFDIVVQRLSGYRGAAIATVKRTFHFGAPPPALVPTPTVIKGTSGTVRVKATSDKVGNSQGTTGGHSYVEASSSKSTRTRVLDIHDVLTGGLLATSVAPTVTVSTDDNLAAVIASAQNLGIVTGANNFTRSTSSAYGTFEANIPPSTPLYVPVGSLVLVAATVEKWRLGVYVQTLIYAQVPA
jgi:hypothetical protein